MLTGPVLSLAVPWARRLASNGVDGAFFSSGQRAGAGQIVTGTYRTVGSRSAVRNIEGFQSCWDEVKRSVVQRSCLVSRETLRIFGSSLVDASSRWSLEIVSPQQPIAPRGDVRIWCPRSCGAFLAML